MQKNYGCPRQSNTLTKKLLLTLTGLMIFSYADAATLIAPQALQSDPICRPVLERLKNDRQQMEKFIQENNAAAVGNIVISDHQLLEQYPQCKPPRSKYTQNASAAQNLNNNESAA